MPLLNTKKQQKGFTLLIAVITVSIILALGMSLMSITLKGFLFSATSREAEVAFYASDAATECALHYDKVVNAFASANPSITCMGQTVTAVTNGATTTFSLSWGASPKVSAEVSVVKRTCGMGCTETVLRASGYNRELSKINDPRTVERALKVEY